MMKAQLAERVDAECSLIIRGVAMWQLTKTANAYPPHEWFKSIPCAFILSHVQYIGVLNNYLNIWR
jgi:glucuronate isomerase